MTISAELRQAFHVLDARLSPEYRAELIAGVIIVNPLPYGDHEAIFAELNFRLTKLSAIDVRISGHRGSRRRSPGLRRRHPRPLRLPPPLPEPFSFTLTGFIPAAGS